MFNLVQFKLTFGCIFKQRCIAEQNQKIVRKAKAASKGSKASKSKQDSECESVDGSKRKLISDDDDAPLIKKNPKGKYSRSSQDDDDSSAGEPVFAIIGKQTSADSGFAKVK